LAAQYQGDQKALADVVTELRLDDAIDRFPLDGGLVRLKHADAYFAFVDAVCCAQESQGHFSCTPPSIGSRIRSSLASRSPTCAPT
jgi:hypothetical protein